MVVVVVVVGVVAVVEAAVVAFLANPVMVYVFETVSGISVGQHVPLLCRKKVLGTTHFAFSTSTTITLYQGKTNGKLYGERMRRTQRHLYAMTNYESEMTYDRL